MIKRNFAAAILVQSLNRNYVKLHKEFYSIKNLIVQCTDIKTNYSILNTFSC